MNSQLYRSFTGPEYARSLVPASDTAALRDAMQRALDDPAGALAEATERLDFVRPRFSIAHMTDQIEALYRDLLVTRRAR